MAEMVGCGSRLLIAANLEGEEAAARRHEADRHDRPERERDQQNAGDPVPTTASAPKPDHVSVRSNASATV